MPDPGEREKAARPRRLPPVGLGLEWDEGGAEGDVRHEGAAE